MTPEPPTRRVSRRALLRAAAAAGITLALPACRRDELLLSPSPAGTATTAATPLGVTSVPGYNDPRVWEGRTLLVTSWGGEYEDAQAAAIFEPFQRLTGARITTQRTDIRELRRQVEAGETKWDLCDILVEDVLPLANIGVLEEIDYNIVDATGVFSELKTTFSLPASYYTTIMSYRDDAWPGMTGPQSWPDYWDVTRFPGSRGLYGNPQTTLEFALLADGVDRDDLYPLDVDRAFVSLERIRPVVTLWWEQGAQPAQTLNSGAVTLVSAWHNRLLNVKREGAPITLVWNNGALSGDSWVAPKGAPNRDVAMDLINFATRPEVTAAFASLVPFGPVHARAFDFLPAEAATYLPTSPTLRDRQFTINFEWWFKRRDAINERFTAWRAAQP